MKSHTEAMGALHRQLADAQATIKRLQASLAIPRAKALTGAPPKPAHFGFVFKATPRFAASPVSLRSPSAFARIFL